MYNEEKVGVFLDKSLGVGVPAVLDVLEPAMIL